MLFQTSLLSLFSLALVFASYVNASAKNNKKDKNERVPVLSDDSTGRGDAVTLPSSPVPMPNSSATSSVQGVPEESQVPERDEQTKKFEELINSNQYEEIAELGKDMNDEGLLKCLCQVVTSLAHFKGLYKYLRQRKMVPGFLAHGETVVVRKVIVKTDLLEANALFGYCDSISDAIALSLRENLHDRVVGLFEAAKKRPDWKNEFGGFVAGFFGRYPLEKDSMPLKRFLALHGEELSKKHPTISKTICEQLVWKLKCQPKNPASQKLLIGLVGQPFLLTPVAFSWGFLHNATHTDQTNFIKYGYKEAIEEGLKERYLRGGRKLWAVMVNEYPSQFSGEYPTTDEARSVALKDFKPTKQDREEEWARKNASNPQAMLRMKLLAEHLNELDVDVPIVLWVIIAEYVTVPTLLDVE